MNKAIVVAIALAAGVGGFFIGKSERGPGGRAGARNGGVTTERRVVELEPERYASLQERAARLEEIEQENRRLKRTLHRVAPGLEELDEEPEPGTRLPDGTIVGGASWSKMTRHMALGFLDGRVQQFFKEANLTEEQQARLRSEMEKRIGEVLQNTADFVNADIDGDQAYDQLENIANESRKLVGTVLDDQQLEVYHRFEKEMVGFVHGNVVDNEMATLRKELRLDREQEKHVRQLVEERYRRVQERLNAPIPNMFFRPIRRTIDRDIYEDTGIRLMEYLRPEQAAAFTLLEERGNDAFTEYRPLLIPKSE